MIRESLILGTLWSLLDTLNRSAAGRAFDALCRRIGALWRESLIVNWFCSPRCVRSRKSGSGERLRLGLCGVWERLGLRRLLEGSVFLQSFLWCAMATVLAPLAPTMAVLGLALVGCGSVLLKAVQERERRLAPMPLNLPAAAYVLCYFIGTLTSVDVRGSLLIGVLTIAFILFSPALYHAADTRRELDILTALMVTAGAAVSCYGILQYLFKWGYQSAAWVDEDMFSSIRFRVGSTMENPNMLGQYLILTVTLGGAKLLGAKGLWRRLYYLACCGVMCVCMILTYSRGAWLGLLFALAAFLVLWQPRLLALVPFGVLALFALMPETVVSRFASIGNMADQSTSYRVSIWLGTLKMLRDGYWLFGIGPGTAAFNRVYPFYSYEAIIAPHSHNLFLQIVCDAGIFALLAFLWVLIRYFRVLCASLKDRSDPAARLLSIGCLTGVLGFLVQAMTDYSFYNYRVMMLFWAWLGVGMMSARRDMPKGGGA